MRGLARTDDLTDEQAGMLKVVRQFVDKEIIPVASELEHRDEYPTDIVEGLKEQSIFGLTIPEEYGGLGESLLTYALVVEEIARGWMSVSGVINTHFIVAYMLRQHGTDSQKAPTFRAWPGARSAVPSRCPSQVADRTSARSRPKPSVPTTAPTRSPARR
jgi:alkylation response protein AidB-like acyl-CoA dehydrogenase